MRSDSAGDVDADCANLALALWVVLFHCGATLIGCAAVNRTAPNACEAADSSGGHAELSAQPNEGLFHQADKINRAESAAAGSFEAAQVKDRVADQLAGTMVGNVAAPIDLVEGHAAAGQKFVRRQNVAAVGIAPESKDRWMFKEQKDVVNPAMESQVHKLGLKAQPFVVINATKIEVLDHRYLDSMLVLHPVRR